MAQLMDGENQLRAWLTGAAQPAAPLAASDRPRHGDDVGGGRAGPVLDGDGLLRHAGR